MKLLAVPPPAGARAGYLQRYYHAIANASVAVMWVTPADARAWLENYNHRNRPVSAHCWRKIRDKISSGLWHLNGEAVVFSSLGVLLNGQHRLRAIAEGAEPVMVLVLFGIDPGAFPTFDQGKRRGGSDILALLDQENCTTLNPAIGWAVRDMQGEMDRTSSQAVPNEQLGDWLDAFPGLVDSVAWAKGRSKSRLAPGGLLAFLHWSLTNHAPDHAPGFFTKVVEGVGVTKPSWEKSLRNRLEGDLAGRRTTADQVMIAALFIKAFNNVLRAEPCKMHRRGDREIEPSVVWMPGNNERFPELAPGPFAPAQ